MTRVISETFGVEVIWTIGVIWIDSSVRFTAMMRTFLGAPTFGAWLSAQLAVSW